jgi:hypothetical protein
VAAAVVVSVRLNHQSLSENRWPPGPGRGAAIASSSRFMPWACIGRTSGAQTTPHGVFRQALSKLMKALDTFRVSVLTLLVVTAAAKSWSVFGESTLLREVDPLFGLSFRTLMVVAATLEIGVAAICLLRPAVDGLLAVAWLSTAFLAYRVGLWWIGWKKPCNCLGNLTDALNISPQVADNVMKGLLAFMLIGSVSLLILHWHNKGAAQPGETSSTPAAVS